MLLLAGVAPPQTQVCKGYLDFKGEVKTMITVGKEIWSGSTNTLIKVWNPQEVRVPPQAIRRVSVRAGADCCVVCGNTQRGGDCVATLEGHNGEVVNFCTNGTSVWSCGWDKQIFLWDVQVRAFPSPPQTSSVSVVVGCG